MIDSHCHLADEAFADDLGPVVSRAQAAGVQDVLCILAAGNADEIARAGAVRNLWPSTRVAIGVHPHNAGDFTADPDSAADVVRSAVTATAASAIGEIGLDYHYDLAPRETQQALFRVQLGVARALGLPVVLHTREADDDTFRILQEEAAGSVTGIFHCFTGDRSRAARALDLGFFVSFAGIVTFPRATEIREAAGYVPADRLLVETDSPYLAPVPHRGKRNEPAWVARTIERIAEVRGEPVERVVECSTRAFESVIARPHG